jgi:hypothetical protein
MDFSQPNIVVPISGWGPNIEPGKKCIHGIYIPSTQEQQLFADNCQVCTGLISYTTYTGKTLEEIEQHVRFLWNRLDKKEKETKPWTFDQLDAIIKEGESK